jgi:raffinose/stachyose/melibiose transport system permease protein
MGEQIRRRGRSPAGQLALLTMIAAVAVAMAAPLVWMLLGSVRTDAEIIAAPFAWPGVWHWDQWQRAWNEGNLGQYGWNSLAVTLLTVAGVVLFGAGAAYPLARSQAATPRLLGFYLLGLIVPSQAAVVPMFLLLRTIHLLDTWWALVLPYVAWNLPFAVLVYYGFFRSQSREPEEAARMDGCGILALFVRIALPLAAPATGVVAVITALGTWNEFLFALLFVHSDSAKTLPLGLLAFSSAHMSDYGLTFAALALMSLPLLLLYALVQRTLIEGSAAVAA